MVKIQGPSDDTVLDAQIRELVDKHGLFLDVIGWTRKTYTVYRSTDHEFCWMVSRWISVWKRRRAKKNGVRRDCRLDWRREDSEEEV